jgi:hypothetical protein
VSVYPCVSLLGNGSVDMWQQIHTTELLEALFSIWSASYERRVCGSAYPPIVVRQRLGKHIPMAMQTQTQLLQANSNNFLPESTRKDLPGRFLSSPVPRLTSPRTFVFVKVNMAPVFYYVCKKVGNYIYGPLVRAWPIGTFLYITGI